MTNMLKTLQSDQLTARKERNTMKATLLTTLLGEATRIGKDDGNRETTDEDVLKTVRKFANNAKDNMANYSKVGNSAAVEQMQQELDVLKQYLPAEIDADVLRSFIASFMAEKNLPKAPSSMKDIMAALNSKYGDDLDKKVASSIAKEMIK